MPTPEEILQRLSARKQQEQTPVPVPVPVNKNIPVQGQIQGQTKATPEELLQRLKERQAAGAQPVEEPGMWATIADVATGSLRGRQELSDLPEVATMRGLTSGSFTDDLQTAAGLMFASNDEAKKDIIKSNFPGTTFKKDKKGNEIATFPDGRKAVLNKPGASFQDMLGFVGDVAAFFGPAKLAGLGKNLVTRFGIGAIAEGATEAGLQKGVQALGSEQPVDPVDVAAAGLTAGAGEIVGSGVQALRQRGLQKALGGKIGGGGGQLPPSGGGLSASIPGDRPEGQYVRGLVEDFERGKQASQQTGIGLSRAQLYDDPTDLARQSYVSMLSGGSRVAAEALKKQNDEAYKAVVDFMETVAPARQIEGAPIRARNAAQLVIDAQKELRSEAAGKFYKEAFRDTKRYQPKITFGLINEKMAKSGTGSNLENAMKRINRMLTPKGTDAQIAQGLQLEVMHEVKRSIWDMIQKNIRKGEEKLAADLAEVQKSLVDEMRGFSPAYDQGRRQYSAMSPAVEALENTLIGRVSRLQDGQLDKITKTIFDPAKAATAVPVIREAKKAIKSVDPEAWNDVVRLELQNRLGAAKGAIEEAGETTENIPGQLYRSIFGNKTRKEILYTALDTEQRKNLKFIEEALRRASKGRPGGSMTAMNQQFEKEIRGLLGRIAQWTNPFQAAKELGQDINFDKRAFALARVMFDPQFSPDMKKLRKFAMDSPEGAAYFSDLMTKAGKDFRKPTAQAIRGQFDED